MRFTLIDPNEPEREFSMLIDISSHAYSGMAVLDAASSAPKDDQVVADREEPVPKCEPVISNMPELVDRLNEDRDLYGFIKRGGFGREGLKRFPCFANCYQCARGSVRHCQPHRLLHLLLTTSQVQVGFDLLDPRCNDSPPHYARCRSSPLIFVHLRHMLLPCSTSL